MGSIIGSINKGDTRSLDYSSYRDLFLIARDRPFCSEVTSLGWIRLEVSRVRCGRQFIG